MESIGQKRMDEQNEKRIKKKRSIQFPLSFLRHFNRNFPAEVCVALSPLYCCYSRQRIKYEKDGLNYLDLL